MKTAALRRVSLSLSFSPSQNLPSNVRLLTSCIPGSKPYASILSRAACTELPLTGLDSEHRRQLIEHYLQQYGKHLMIEALGPVGHRLNRVDTFLLRP